MCFLVLKLGSIPALTPSALGGPVSPAAAVQPTAAVGLPTAAAVHQPVTAAAAAAAATAATAAHQPITAPQAAAHPPTSAACLPTAATADDGTAHSTAPIIRGPLLRLPSAKFSSSHTSVHAAQASRGQAGPRSRARGGLRKTPATYAPPPPPPPPPPPAPLPPSPCLSEHLRAPLPVPSPAAAPVTLPLSGMHTLTPQPH
eukprot:99451-Pelagomonas_calceolata.AAC.1